MGVNLLLLLSLSGQTPWHRVAEDDGLLLETRPSEQSALEEIRISGTSTASAEAFAQAWWGQARDTSTHPEVSSREVLAESDTERLFYDVVHAPVISDRDYLVRSTKQSDAASGTLTLTYRSVEDPRKPPTRSRVRMRVMATITVSPSPGGGCHFVYAVSSDIGGSIPVLLVRGFQRRSVQALAREIRRRAERR